MDPISVANALMRRPFPQQQLALNQVPAAGSGGDVTYSLEHGATGHKTPLGADIKQPLQIQRNMFEYLGLPTRIHGDVR
jgi:hypothetical protein